MEQRKNYFLTLNIFKKPSGSHQEVDEDSYEERTQVIATRIYFLLLISILFIFLLITCLDSKTITETVLNPTLSQIQSLPADRICPCSRTSFSYDKFVSNNVSFHQVCSSDFVSDRWISSLFHGINASYFLPNDIRSVGFAEFQALASFCRLSQASANQTLLLFGSSPFISLDFDSSLESLRTKIITTFNRFNSSMSTTFKNRIELISRIIMSNHLLNAMATSVMPKTGHLVATNGRKLGYWFLGSAYGPNGNCKCTQTETLANEGCRGVSGIYKEFDVDADYVEYYYDNTSYVNNHSGALISRHKPYVPTIKIPEFASSCMPVDACLMSSLECFFNQSCVNAILPYQTVGDGMIQNFTALNSDYVLKLSRFNITSRIKSIVDELMVEEWFIREDYDKYFQQCAPVACTYVTNIYSNFLNVLNIFIGLLGGLCTGLGLVVLPVVRFIRRRLWPPPVNTESSQSPRISGICPWCQQILSKIKRFLIELNLFKINLNVDDQSQIRYQRIATRLYIAVLALSFVILTIYLSLNRQTYVETIKNATQAEFSHYYYFYRPSFQCACSSISIPYHVFLTIEPHYHQMCSSDLVSSTWIKLLKSVAGYTIRFGDHFGFSENAASQFLLLKELCNAAEQMITTSLEQFLNQTFISSQLVPEESFEKQTNASIEEWKALIRNNFLRILQFIQDIQYGNHLAAARSNSDLDLDESWNTFILNSSIFYEECNCMLSPSCLSTMKVNGGLRGSILAFDVPGLFVGCFRVKALLNSTLETFYNQTFVDIIQDVIIGEFKSLKMNFTALNATRNLPNETIDSVVSKLFVDDWRQSILFSNYFTFCGAQSCTYKYVGRQNLLSLITSVISIFGGLSTALRIVFTVLLWLIMKVTRSNISLRAMRRWLHIRLTEKQHLINGLCIVLIVIALITLYFASKFTPQTTTEQIINPVLEKYEELLADYSDNLQCPCVQMSILHKSFMNVTISSRHQVCSSSFIADEWITTLLLPEPQSNHSSAAFNKTAIGFFQLLASLCELSEWHLTDAISDLMTRSLINTNVISRRQLNEQIKSIIDQFELSNQFSFLATLQLIRAMISDNQIMTVFETNWKWIPPSRDHPRGNRLPTEPIVYNGSCNCALFSQCVEESSMMPGLMVGCYPLESLLKSTLQCLYNVSCISLLQPASRSFTPLNGSSPSRYKKNSTVEFILNKLMVEQWNNSIEYEKYYKQCAPSLCSYSYTDRRPTLQVLALILGLYSGLMIIINVVALLFVALWQKVLIRQRSHVQVQPL